MSPEHVEDIYKLSPIQQGLLFHSLYEPESGAYFEQFNWLLSGTLDPAVFQRAWQYVVDRHAILRTAFFWEDLDEPLQVVQRQAALPFAYHDWRGMPEAEQAARLAAYLQAERSRGFALEQAPLMRVAVMQLTDDRYRCVGCYHHLLLDGWSIPLLEQEVATCYAAFARHQQPRLKRRRPYRDYITWLRQQDLAQAEQYWRRTLAGFTAPTPLQVDRATEQPEGYDQQTLHLSSATTQALQELVRQEHLTLSTLVAGAWSLVLSRYSREQDLVFGVTVSGRPADLPGVESMIGLFINTLPLRVRLAPELPLLEWLRSIQAQQFELQQYEYSPLAQVQKWSAVPGGTSLFDSIFVFENFPLTSAFAEESGHALTLRETQMIEPTSYPLTIKAQPGAQLELRIGYARHRFDPATIDRMLGHLATLLEQIAHQPAQRLMDVHLLTEAERRQILVGWNQTQAAPAIEPTSIHGIFEAQARRIPGALALIFEDARLTYDELNRQANRLAWHLLGLGLRPESRVGICMERCVEQLIAVLGVLKAGGTYVPLDPNYPQERLAFMIANAEVGVLLTQQRWLDTLPEQPTLRLCLDRDGAQIAAAPSSDPDLATHPDQIAYITYTSGSTGTPKGIGMTHRALLNLLDWQLRHTDLQPGARTLQFASLSFDVSFQDLFSTWALSGTVVGISEDVRRDVVGLSQVLCAQAIERLFIPAVALQQVAEGFRSVDAAACRLRHVIAGSEQLQLTPALVEMFERLPECALHNEYGPSETHVVTAYDLPRATADWPKRPPIGRPIANTQVYLVDPQMHPVPIGVPGEVYLGGAQLARGYIGRPDLTAERFVPDPFGATPGGRLYRTGDLARYLPDGNIEFLGRADHQVKIRGFRVEPGEVEVVLGRNPAIRECVVVARADTTGHHRLVAYVVPMETPGPTTSDLRLFLKQRLPDYMVPSVFVKLDALPLNTNGKVDRKALPAPDSARPELRDTYVAPRTELERKLAEIWMQAIGVQQVGVHDNFFELGGDSIITLQVVSRAAQAGIHLTVKQVFDHATIAELATVAGTTSGVAASQALVTGPVPLTPIQHWFFHKVRADVHHWNMDVLLETQPDVDPDLLDRIIQHLVVHHDALRMRYFYEDGRWQQVSAEPGAPVPFSVIDLSDAAPAEQLAAVEQAATRLQFSMNLAEPPLFRAVFFNFGADRPGRLYMVMHHLIVDAFSWRVLLEDMQTAYRQLSAGQPIALPPKTTSYQRWAERLSEHAQSETLRQELAHWLSIGDVPFTPLPRDVPDGENSTASTRLLQMILSVEETQALLQDVPKAYQSRINDVLMAALSYAIKTWTGSPHVLIDLEGHGREDLFDDVDMTRTVGWCPSISPVLLDLRAAATPLDALPLVRDQMRQIPRRGVGYGMLRYMSEDAAIRERLQALPQAEVMLNYFGQFDQVVANSAIFRHMAQEPTGPLLSPNGNRFTVLFIHGQVVQGRLMMVFHYSQNVHRRETIQKVVSDFTSALRVFATAGRSFVAGGAVESEAVASLPEV
ncbi:MAG TPA: amino acid adenylation domain-containing protein [Herpetosiphonaceae bacterium]